MTEKNKKRTVIAVSFVAVMLVLIGVVIAYFASDDEKANEVAVGENEIEITERFTPPAQEKDYSYSKLVKISNTGKIPCYIRVALEFSDSGVEKVASFSSAAQNEGDSVPAEDSFYKAGRPEASDPGNSAYYINHLPEGWVYVWEGNKGQYPELTPGYYYYTAPVAAGADTEALISWVRLNYDSTGDIKAYDIFVYSESVQTIDPVSGEAYENWQAAWKNFV